MRSSKVVLTAVAATLAVTMSACSKTDTGTGSGSGSSSGSATPVADIMTADVVTVGPEDSVEHCMRVCTQHRIRQLPVLDGGRVVGVLSIGDLVKAVIDDQGEQIEHLQRYIAG